MGRPLSRPSPGRWFFRKCWPENGSKPSETKINIGVSAWKSDSVCVQWPAALVLLALGAERRGEERENTTTNPIAHQGSGIWFFKDFGF